MRSWPTNISTNHCILERDAIRTGFGPSWALRALRSEGYNNLRGNGKGKPMIYNDYLAGWNGIQGDQSMREAAVPLDEQRAKASRQTHSLPSR